ncbi:hypothetical protein COO91_02045 [Nostoc flagelliforme CCNUN1]|uniref:Uncharacterized protein n=1 Tax=Nostoc flagelliforme CCNUN1 TaxID=2038116 RepID=A0A2K8SKZ5_9NOSO|nr:hypothetical protein [Nostoc flagelliforme]AUB36144.1 hypothetical protein COO91_02045 [Nostoc flagelliforme CCNUN1]
MTSIGKTIKIRSDVRPDLGYIIIDADDFDPRTQVLWTPEEIPPVEQKLEDSAEVPPVEQKSKPKTKRHPVTVTEETGETEEDVATPLP